MEVTLITMVYPHPRAGFWPGIERQVACFAGALRDAGVDVNVITSFRNGGSQAETLRGIRIYRVPDSVHRYGRLGAMMNMHVKSLGANALKLTEVIRRSNVVESFIPLPHAPALRGAHPSLVAFFPHRDRSSRWSEYLIHPEHFRMERRFYRRVKAIIVSSAESKRVLIEEYDVPDSKIRVVPLGVEPLFLEAVSGGQCAPIPERQSAGRDRVSRLLYVGLMIPRKSVVTLVDALALLRRSGLDFRAVLAGDGPERARLRARADRLGIGALVEFPGRVREEDLPALYRGADLFVFPSIKEGFGLVMVEAMACGLPVVASDAPPMPEVVGEAGLFFRHEDPADLAAVLLRVLRDSELRRRLGTEGVRRVRERFIWSRIAERTIEIYRELEGLRSASPARDDGA